MAFYLGYFSMLKINFLKRADSVKGTPGENVLHETVEAYNGAKINQKENIGIVPPAIIGEANTVYKEAHANSPGGQAADQVVYNTNPPKAGQVKYNSSTKGSLRIKGIIIQTFPKKM